MLAYTGYGSSGPGWVRVLGRVLLSPPGVSDSGERSVRGWRHFVSAKLAGVPVTIQVGGVRQVAQSGRGGYIDTVVPVDLPPGWSTAVLSVPGAPDAVAPLRVVGPEERLGIITDVDDTVLVTALPRPLLAFWNTFVRHEESRRPVPGTVELFARADPAGAGRVRRLRLDRRLERGPCAAAIPAATGATRPVRPLLTDWGPTPEGWFRSGQDHKRTTFRRLLDELPQLRWVLVGDDGQHDPQLYDELVWARPERVRLVAIRRLGATEQLLTHGLPMPLPTTREAEARGPRTRVPWVFGPGGHALVAEMRRLGLLDDGTLAP